MFNDLGASASPGPAHNLLTHCVSLLNVRLVLTTNFDNLIEDSLSAEGHHPVVFDVHLTAPPPPDALVKRHLSIVKLHGSSYGLRADRSIYAPLDEGHLHTFLDYFDQDALLICLDYGGGDSRVMGLIDRILKVKTAAHVIRADGMVPRPGNPFLDLPKKQVTNLFYSPSGLFLLHLHQLISGKLPRSRSIYPAVIHSPAPHREAQTLGCGAQKDENLGPKRERRHSGTSRGIYCNLEGISDKDGTALPERYRAALITGNAGCGTSQVLAQVCEWLYTGYQMFWSDLDEAASVGTVLARLYDFALVRQPDLPRTPLSLDLPNFTSPGSDQELVQQLVKDFPSIKRVVQCVWNRLSQGRYVIAFDSLSYALTEMIEPGLDDKVDARLRYEACRLLLSVSLLFQRAAQMNPSQRCIFLLGTHTVAGKQLEGLNTLLHLCTAALDAAHPDKDDLKAVMTLLVHCDTRSKQSGGGAEEAHLREIEKLWKGVDQSLSNPSQILLRNNTSRNPAFCYEALNDGDYKYTFPNGTSLNLKKLKGLSDEENLEAFFEGVHDEPTQDALSVYLKFLFDCALCNRPRSWCQILGLPEVHRLPERNDFDAVMSNLEPEIPEDFSNWDYRSRAAYSLLKKATKAKFLYLQPGGFYYMDGGIREWLRGLSKSYEEYNKVDAVSGRSQLMNAHAREMRYYERTYNQSGDVTALHYFYWHGLELLKKETAKKGTIKEIARCLLENTQAARGHLNAYDHCLLLLRLMDLTKNVLVSEPEELQNVGGRVLKALGDLYEDNEDAMGGQEVLDDQIRIGVMDPKGADYQHELQKICSRKLDLVSSLDAGLTALEDLLDKPNSSNGLRQKLIQLPEYLKDINIPDGENLLFHRVVLRLTRVLLRVSRFAGSRSRFGNKREINESIKALQKTGKNWLARMDESDEGAKLLWARYHVLRAMRGLYMMGVGQEQIAKYQQEKTVKILYYLDLAKGYASKVGGGIGKTYEAVTDLSETEVLLWESRFIMSLAKSDKKKEWNWGEAFARQEAAVRDLERVRQMLPQGRTSLVWWRDLAILHAGSTADILKLILCQNETIFGIDKPIRHQDSEKVSEAVEKASRHLERGTSELKLLTPVIWNDRWRESRLLFQQLRLSWYLCGFLSIACECLEVASLKPSQGALIASVNRILRAMRNLDLWESDVPLLPIIDSVLNDDLISDDNRVQARANATLEKHWEDFELQLGEAMTKMNASIFEKFKTAASTTERPSGRGLDGSFDSMLKASEFFAEVFVKQDGMKLEHIKMIKGNKTWRNLSLKCPNAYQHGDF